MSDTVRVVLYGSSLYMTGLAVSLQADPALEIVHILADAAGVERILQAGPTAAIVYELEEIPSNLVVDYINAHPGLMLIRMDLASENILLLSGRHVCIGTMTDMIRLLTGALSGNPRLFPKGASAAVRGGSFQRQ